MDYQLVSSDEDLIRVCDNYKHAKVLALDTEFVRTRTLTPQLGLVQLFDGEQLVLIDPLEIRDFEPLKSLLVAPEIVKVIHACSEDLETFNTAFNLIPSPVFDTQFASAVLGLGNSMGYARMIEMLLSVALDKGEARTDWLARPLSDNQLHYAANDVRYLLPAYYEISQQIDAKGKAQWIYQEAACIGDKKRFRIDPNFAYLQVKNNWRLSSRQLTVLQALCAWRMQIAEQRNLALNFVVKESHLYEIALRLPVSKTALANIYGISPHVMRRYSETLLQIVSEALKQFDSQPESEQLPVVKRLIDIPEYKKTLAIFRQLAEQLAEEHEVTTEIIASKKQLNQLLKWAWFEPDETRAMNLLPDVLCGWRKPLFEATVQKHLGINIESKQ